MIAWIRSYLGASKKLLAQVLVLGVIAVVFAIGLMFVAFRSSGLASLLRAISNACGATIGS